MPQSHLQLVLLFVYYAHISRPKKAITRKPLHSQLVPSPHKAKQEYQSSHSHSQLLFGPQLLTVPIFPKPYLQKSKHSSVAIFSYLLDNHWHVAELINKLSMRLQKD